MKTYQFVSIAAAALLTFASLNAIDYNVPVQATKAAPAQLVRVTNLPPIHVYPSAAELRGLSVEAGTADPTADLAATAPTKGGQADSAFQLVGAALSMSHYSQVPSVGRISKE